MERYKAVYILKFVSVMILFSGVPKTGAQTLNVSYTIDVESEIQLISPLIYGSNNTGHIEDNLTVRRMGGNRMTGYNWETNYSNAGSDWYHSSDHWLARNLPESKKFVPGMVMRDFHEFCLDNNQETLMTLPMAGYVAADIRGTVDEAETAPSNRWKEIVYKKTTAFCSPVDNPSRTDVYAYMDECVNMLSGLYGNSESESGIRFYALDNEPALWAYTHPRIHPQKLACSELIERSTALATAIKDIDPQAGIFGPVLYGFGAFDTLQDAPDWNNVKGNYDWFIDYYLDQMKQAEIMQGRRLLDVLDLHWYPEARGDGVRITENLSSYSRANADARMQAPRTLWDAGYYEDSWIGQWRRSFLPLLPKILNSIEAWYPDTKLAFTEYNYGGTDHISGGIAMADVLGIFGKYGVYMSTIWHFNDQDYISTAFRLYRNYDGAMSAFGDTHIYAAMSDKINSSIYAATESSNPGRLHVIVMNKNFEQSIQGMFQVINGRNLSHGRVWAFDSTGLTVMERAPVEQIDANHFTYTITPLTVCHIVLEPEAIIGDLSGNGTVDLEDLDSFKQNWLMGPLPELPGDLNADNRINMLDYLIFSRNWKVGF